LCQALRSVGSCRDGLCMLYATPQMLLNTNTLLSALGRQGNNRAACGSLRHSTSLRDPSEARGGRTSALRSSRKPHLTASVRRSRRSASMVHFFAMIPCRPRGLSQEHTIPMRSCDYADLKSPWSTGVPGPRPPPRPPPTNLPPPPQQPQGRGQRGGWQGQGRRGGGRRQGRGAAPGRGRARYALCFLIMQAKLSPTFCHPTLRLHVAVVSFMNAGCCAAMQLTSVSTSARACWRTPGLLLNSSTRRDYG
jgi:hypothetical protein